MMQLPSSAVIRTFATTPKPAAKKPAAKKAAK